MTRCSRCNGVIDPEMQTCPVCAPTHTPRRPSGPPRVAPRPTSNPPDAHWDANAHGPQAQAGRRAPTPPPVARTAQRRPPVQQQWHPPAARHAAHPPPGSPAPWDRRPRSSKLPIALGLVVLFVAATFGAFLLSEDRFDTNRTSTPIRHLDVGPDAVLAVPNSAELGDVEGHVVTGVDQPSLIGSRSVGTWFQIDAGGAQPDTPLALTIDADSIGAGNRDNVFVARWDDQSAVWVPQPTTLQGDQVVAVIDHLSLFGLFEWEVPASLRDAYQWSTDQIRSIYESVSSGISERLKTFAENLAAGLADISDYLGLHRYSRPECDTSNEVVVTSDDDAETAVTLSCAEPTTADEVSVKVRNNRPYGMLLQVPDNTQADVVELADASLISGDTAARLAISMLTANNVVYSPPGSILALTFPLEAGASDSIVASSQPAFAGLDLAFAWLTTLFVKVPEVLDTAEFADCALSALTSVSSMLDGASAADPLRIADFLHACAIDVTDMAGAAGQLVVDSWKILNATARAPFALISNMFDVGIGPPWAVENKMGVSRGSSVAAAPDDSNRVGDGDSNRADDTPRADPQPCGVEPPLPPGAQVLDSNELDVDNDGREDRITQYRANGDYWIRVVLGDGTYAETEFAPVEINGMDPILADVPPELYAMPDFDGLLAVAVVGTFATGHDLGFWRMSGCRLEPFVKGEGEQLVINDREDLWRCRDGGDLEVIRPFNGLRNDPSAFWEGMFYTIDGAELHDPSVLEGGIEYGQVGSDAFDGHLGCTAAP